MAAAAILEISQTEITPPLLNGFAPNLIQTVPD